MRKFLKVKYSKILNFLQENKILITKNENMKKNKIKIRLLKREKETANNIDNFTTNQYKNNKV